MKQLSRNIKTYTFSLLDVIMEANILRKVLDYSFKENKFYVPHVECIFV